MAATTERSRRIDLDLDAVRADVEDLPEVERGWGTESEPNQRAWRMEWWDVMGRVQSLHEAYTAGQMSDVQQQQYRALLDRVREMIPIIERLQLALPPVSLEASRSPDARHARR